MRQALPLVLRTHCGGGLLRLSCRSCGWTTTVSQYAEVEHHRGLLWRAMVSGHRCAS